MPNDPATTPIGKRLVPPAGGATVRMYRTGHGDCFLLAFPGTSPERPSYVLIDCGYKPGSPAFIDTTAAEITKSIRESTGGHVDVAVINWALPRPEFHAYLRRLVEAGFGQRIMFGSDQMVWPDAIGRAVEGIESAAFLSEQQKRDIFYNNAIRFLRLEKK